MRTDKDNQTIDLKTVRLAWDKKTDGWRRSSVGDIEFSYIERPSGRLRYKTTRSADEASARSVVNALKAGLNEPLDQAREPTFAEVVEAYAARRPCSSYVIKARALSRAFGERRLSTLTDADIANYETYRLKTIGSGTLRNELGALKTIRAFAVAKRLIPVDKAGALVTIEQPAAQKRSKNRYALSETETDQLWDTVVSYQPADRRPSPRLSRAARFGGVAIDTGARKTAIVTLKWKQIDFVNKLIHFDQCERIVPKNKKVGVSPMTPRLERLLKRAYAERQSEFVLDSAAEIDPTWQSAVRGTPFAHVHPHILRHSWITNMVKRGNSIDFIAEIIKDDPKTLRETYQHLEPGWLRDQMKWSAAQLGAPPAFKVAAE